MQGWASWLLTDVRLSLTPSYIVGFTGLHPSEEEHTEFVKYAKPIEHQLERGITGSVRSLGREELGHRGLFGIGPPLLLQLPCL